ncbi:hypothetical protein Y032_0385g421 [Ancylostoma ceylanicum]|uniref:Peptidase M13 N-terminal domain-containing protein n=1 Tax=Ancylostoma ceylanicum TaxID=53326 RepID=A0A016RST3_9BILA|nr:hypothetical protein Y032_0385g421 [Ancylostoma ceylanicum]
MLSCIFAGLLEEDRGPQDSPLARAQSFYKKCLSSNDEWKSRGGPIQFILEKIREFGSFPLIDKSWSYGYHFDITDLLVYFNQNRTIMRELVPYISLDWMDNSVARLTFIPDQSVLKKLLGIGQNDAIDPGKFLKAFGQLALLICEEVGHNCSAGEVSEELKEMYLFVQKISANTTKDSLADEKNYNSIFLHRLSEVDALVSSVVYDKAPC